jgi:hypothetical protein
MAGIGARLRMIRQEWQLSLREVEERSRRIAQERGDLSYQISASWLPIEGGVPGGVRLVSGLVALTPSQTLDGIAWENVVFVNTRIRYLGGPVTLKNVRFVNCTFDIKSSAPGEDLLQYAVLNKSELTIANGPKAN